MAGAFLMPVGWARAAQYGAGGISLKVDTQVNGQPSNYISTASGSAKFQVIFTVMSLVDVNGQTNPGPLVTGSGSNADTLGEQGSTPSSITNLGTGIDIAGNGNTCKSETTAGVSAWTCSFPGGTVALPGQPLTVGQQYAMNVTLDKAALDSLKLTAPCAFNSGQTACFSVYPYFNLTGSKYVLNNAGMIMYASSSPTPPPDVPGYSSQISATGSTTSDSPIIKLINQLIGGLIGLIQEFVYFVFGLILTPLLVAMLSIRTYTDTFAGVIYPGWVIVRNACNILFIVSIIAIGLGTLFRVESYQYKHLLVQLIIAALLVIFSLVIGQAVLGLADTVQNQFLPNSPTVINALGANLMINFRQYTNTASWVNASTFSNTVQPLVNLSLALGAFVVFAAIAVFLLIRMVMLWVLLMISPIAYVAGVLPTTAHFRGEWWSNFIKYAFFTPIIAFFLNIAATLVGNQATNPVLQTVNNASFNNSSLENFLFHVGSNLVLIVFLFISLEVANRMGIYGGSAVAEIGRKGMLAPFAAVGGAAKGLGTVAGHRLERFHNEVTSKLRGPDEKIPFWRAAAFAALNPVAFTKGLKKQSEERQHRAAAKAEATGLEVAEQRAFTFNPLNKAFWKGSYKRNPHVLQHEKEEEDEQAKKLQNLSREEVAKRVHQFYRMGDSEEEMAYKRGGYKLAMSKGYIDDVVGLAHENEDGKQMIKDMIAKNLLHTDDFTTSDLQEVGADGKLTKNKVVKRGDKYFAQYKDAAGALQEREIDDDHLALVASNHSTRRALQMSLFGGGVSRGFVHSSGPKKGEFYEAATAADPADGAAETYHIADHAAARLITQEGETEAKATGHLEYMTDQKFNAKTGHYESYILRKKTKEVKDGAGNVTARTEMWVSDGEKDMAAAEIAKVESRKLAQMAWHSLVSSDGANFSEDIYRVAAVAMVENPGFMQQRQADFLVNGETQTDQVIKNKENLKNAFEGRAANYELNINNQNFANNIQKMWEVNKDAAMMLLLRNINKANERALDKFKADLAGGKRVVINGVSLQ